MTMNRNFGLRTFCVLGFTAATVVYSGLKAQAQTSNYTSSVKTEQNLNLVAQADGTAPGTYPNQTYPGTTPTTPGNYPYDTNPGTTPTTPGNYPYDTNPDTTPTTPGNYPYDTNPDTTPTTPGNYPYDTNPSQTNPTPGFEPGRATRGGASYVGIGGNIGLSGGETALGVGNFSVISKIGLTNSLSVRPSAMIGDNTTFLVPLTYDFPSQQREISTRTIPPFAPYVGAGVAVSTGDDSDVGPMLTAGVDVPIDSRFTATGAVNVGFVNDTSTGVVLGVGYNF